jgi:hypothetical protein
VDASGDYLGCYSPPDAKFLSLETLAAGWRQLQMAEAAAGADGALRHRVRVAQLPLLYAFIVRWEALRSEAAAAQIQWPVNDTIQATYERFMAIAEAEKVTRVAEGRTIDWLKSVMERTQKP